MLLYIAARKITARVCNNTDSSLSLISSRYVFFRLRCFFVEADCSRVYTENLECLEGPVILQCNGRFLGELLYCTMNRQYCCK